MTAKTLSEKLSRIDDIERLGVEYHFEGEIEQAIQQVYDLLYAGAGAGTDLCTDALAFRLLRQHYYNVPTDVFEKYKTKQGGFKNEIADDIEGMLSLYEAAYLRTEHDGDRILDKAIEFTRTHLMAKVDQMESPLAKRVNHSLDLPLRKGVQRVEHQFYISIYGDIKGHDPTLLKLAKLSFNVVQNLYQQELRFLTKWDTRMEGMEDRMKILFEAIIGVYEEIDSITSKEGKPYCLHLGKLALKHVVRWYMEEARWYGRNYVPRVEEYRQNSSLSTLYQWAAYTLLCGMGDSAPEVVFDWLFSTPKLLIASSDHCRLRDDILSHEFEQKRGHAASSVQCYMKEHGVGKEEAIIAIKSMAEEDWKIMNWELLMLNPPTSISKEVLSIFVGLAKVMEVLYRDIDGYTNSNTTTKDMLTELLINHFQI
ncbi:Valencene synthase [Linum perenne]